MAASRTFFMLFLSFGFLLAATPRKAEALQEFSADQKHRGVVDFGDYQIFPENRLGNGVYYESRLLLSFPDKALVNLLPLTGKPERFVFSTVNQSVAKLGINFSEQDKQLRFQEISTGLYYAIFQLEGVIHKKLYQLFPDGTIQDTLPYSRTADGATLGKEGVAFYHVAFAGEDAEGAREFGLRLHFMRYQEKKVYSLPKMVNNKAPSLNLSWKGPKSLAYSLASGEQQTLSLKDFR